MRRAFQLHSQSFVIYLCCVVFGRAVFTAVPELEYICLVKANTGDLGEGLFSHFSVNQWSAVKALLWFPPDSTLDETFQLLQPLTAPRPQCAAFICHRQQHCPRLHIRPARWLQAPPTNTSTAEMTCKQWRLNSYTKIQFNHTNEQLPPQGCGLHRHLCKFNPQTGFDPVGLLWPTDCMLDTPALYMTLILSQ